LDADGNVVQQGVPIATQGEYARLIEQNPGIRIIPSQTGEGLTDADYFSKFGMPKDQFLALPIEDQRRLQDLADDPKTLTERQRQAIIEPATLDNLETLSPQEFDAFFANVAEYLQETVSPAGVSERNKLPPNTQAAMRRAYSAGKEFPGIDPSLFGAPMRPAQMERVGLALLDTNNVDLGAATGLLSPFTRAVNIIGEQAAEVLGGTGTVFTQTAEASSALNTLAAATRRFYIDGRVLAKEYDLLVDEIPTFSGFTSDAAARRALTQQRNLLEGNLRRVEEVLENPANYTNKDISDARQLKTYADQLLLTYDEFIKAYRRLDGGGDTSLTYEQILENYRLGD
jgi:hypothetical protein